MKRVVWYLEASRAVIMLTHNPDNHPRLSLFCASQTWTFYLCHVHSHSGGFAIPGYAISEDKVVAKVGEAHAQEEW